MKYDITKLIKTLPESVVDKCVKVHMSLVDEDLVDDFPAIYSAEDADLERQAICAALAEALNYMIIENLIKINFIYE